MAEQFAMKVLEQIDAAMRSTNLQIQKEFMCLVDGRIDSVAAVLQDKQIKDLVSHLQAPPMCKACLSQLLVSLVQCGLDLIQEDLRVPRIRTIRVDPDINDLA